MLVRSSGCWLLALLCSSGCWWWWQAAEAQTCVGSRSLSQQRFGFLKAAAQGANSSFVYVVLLSDLTAAPGPEALGCAANASVGLAAVQKVEAMLWAAETFRSRYPSLLGGVSVGVLALDACGSGPRGLQLLANLLSCETTFGSSPAVVVQPSSAIAVVGVDSPAVAGDALPLLQTVGRATVSYQLTSAEFARSAFPLLARLAPDDLAEAEALAQATRASGARHAQLLYSGDSRRSAMAAALAARLPALGVCVAASRRFSASAAAGVNELAGVRPVLLLLSTEDLASFAEQMLRLLPSSGTFTWLLASEHAASIEALTSGKEAFFAGALLLAPYARQFAEFESSFRSLRPDAAGSAARNPWLADFWTRRFACNLPTAPGGYSRTCNFSDPSQNLQSVSTFDTAASRIVQATDLTLHSLELTRRAVCGATSVGLCSAFLADAARFKAVYDNLFKVKAALGYGDVELSADTGGPAAYTLLLRNFQRRGAGYAWTTVGSFISGTLVVASSPLAYGVGGVGANWTSACSAACLAACPAAPATTTAASAATTTAAGNATSLAELRFRSQYWVYALIVCASVGVIICVLFLIFILFNVLGLPSELKTFNTLWSGQFLLLVLLLGYVTLFAWVPWPTKEFCGILRFMVGFLYAAIYSILMVKLLNLINEHLTPVYQVLLFFFGLAVQVATSAEWLLLVPSAVVPSATGSRCSHDFLDHLKMLVYCMVLILLCSVLAVRAHSIGRNNREAIFIGCTAGLSIPVWIAWTLVGALNETQDFKDASMAFGLFVNLTLVLLVIFIPKVYQLRRLEDEEEEEEDIGSATVIDYDETKEPIYVLSHAAPSVRSEPNVYVTSSPVVVNPRLSAVVENPRLSAVVENPRAHSEAGDGPVGVGLQSRRHRRAYSEFGGNNDDRASAKEATKAERLEKLGFL